MSNESINSPQETALPVDVDARQQALIPNQSFAVSAPAGSGKTELLAQRVLTLLSTCKEPENILSITFTRKAAREMLARIMKALESAQGPEPEEGHKKHTWQLAKKALEQDHKYQWQLLENPNRLNIKTIDGLCRSLARQLPIESGLGAIPDTLQFPEQAYLEAAQQTLLLLDHPEHGAFLETLLLHLDNNTEAAEKLLVSLLANRDIWLGDVLATKQVPQAYFQQALTTLTTETLSQAQEVLTPFASDIALLADFAGTYLSDNSPESESPLKQCAGITTLPEVGPEALPLWLGICELLLTQKGDWRKRVDKRAGFPTDAQGDKALAKTRKQQLSTLIAHLEQIEALNPLLSDIRHLPPTDFPTNQWTVLEALTHLLPLSVAQLKLVFQAKGGCDHTEITLAALQALGDEESPSDLNLLLDHTIQHILVDEFQDTSSSQLTLLNRLTAGWEAGDGRTVFVVGDGMQSIYGFRNANVGIFLDIRKRGLNNVAVQPLDLTVNFRSDKGVVNWVNTVFKQAFPHQDDIARGAVSYTDAVAHRPEKSQPAVSTQLYSDSQYEAEDIAKLVKGHLEKFPNDNLAILVRVRSHLTPIVKALRENGISWQATDIDPLAQRQCILDLLSLTKAMLNPADRISWLALLRSPWVGLQLPDLHILANYGRSHTEPDWPVLWQQLNDERVTAELSIEGQQILQRVLPILKEAWVQRRRKPLRQWVEGIWTALGGEHGLLTPSQAVDIPAYFNLLEQHDEAATIADWPDFQQAVNKLFAAPLPDGDPRVQVMTIHKSKGLEFDTVIIPGLARSSRSDEKPLLCSQERISQQGQPQLLIAPMEATGSDSDPLYSYLRREEKRKQTLESTRLLYVGVTRAVSRLYLTASLGVDEKKSASTSEVHAESNPQPQPKSPPANSLLATIWPVISSDSNQFSYSVSDTLSPVKPEDNDLPPESGKLVRLPCDWQPPIVPEATLLQTFRGATEGYESGQETDNYLNHTRAQRIIGTVLHRTLQHITLQGYELWDEERIQKQLPLWETQLREQGLIQDTHTALNKLQGAVTGILNSLDGQWLLNNQHENSACELSISYRRGGRIRQAVIDRTFVAENTRWIVDYKSAIPEIHQPFEDFLLEQRRHYGPQLKNYRKLFVNMEDRPIKTALYYPQLGYLDKFEKEIP